MKKKDYNDLFVPTYKRTGAPFISGKGSYLFDSDNKKYLDFGSGIAVNALGHAHPVLKKTIKEQGELLLHSSNLYFNKPQIDLAEKLIKNSFAQKVFFCNSGTEANEAAIKFARKKAISISEDKYHVLSFYDGFHGRTYGALSATAQEKFHQGFLPMLDGFHYVKLNDIEATEQILKKYSFAAVIIEPLQGEGGINSTDTSFLKFLRNYTAENSIALVFDEIQCGMGRTGTLWNYQQHKVIPDMMTLAKPLGGGLPLGAVLCKKEFSDSITPGDHGTTFGGNPVSCALGSRLLSIIKEKAFLKEVRQKGNYLKKKLSALQSLYPVIESIRGSGLLLGVRFTQDPQPLIPLCKENGLILIKANHNTIRFIPPLTVKLNEIDKAVSIFTKSLKHLYS